MNKRTKNIFIFVSVCFLILIVSRFVWGKFFEKPLPYSMSQDATGAVETQTGSNIVLDSFEYTPKKIDLEKVGEVPSVAKVCAGLPNTKDYYKYIHDFYKTNKNDFLKIYIGESEELPSISGNQIYYVFDNCDDLKVGTPLHGECTIRQTEKAIFLPSLGIKVTNIVGLPEIDFVKIQGEVNDGKCKALKEDTFFAKYAQFCGDEKGYIEYLNKISLGFLQALCGK